MPEKNEKSPRQFLSFVEEAVLNPDYLGCIGGRVEVIDRRFVFSRMEFRYLTRKVDELSAFRDKWDLKDVDDDEAAQVAHELADRFMDGVKREAS